MNDSKKTDGKTSSELRTQLRSKLSGFKTRFEKLRLPLKTLWQLGRLYWLAPENRKSWVSLAAIIGLIVLGVRVGIKIPQMAQHLAEAFNPYDYAQIINYSLLAVALLLLQKLLDALSGWFKTSLNLSWRQWQSRRMIEQLYDEEGRPYIRVFQDPAWKQRLPIPDYVMTQDANDLPNVWTGFAFPVGDALLKLLQNGSILLGLSYVYSLSAVGFVAISYVAVFWLGRKLFALNQRQVDAEWDLKVLAGRPRVFGDAIAFGQGERVARNSLIAKLKTVITIWQEMRDVNFWLGLFSSTWVEVIPYGLAVLVASVEGHVNYGVVIATTGYFTNFFRAANVIPDQFANIANLTKILERMAAFEAATRALGNGAGRHIAIASAETLSFDKVTILAADSNRVLWKDFCFTLEKGSSVLLVAPNVDALGLTSFARTLVGLQNKGSGTIKRPPLSHMMFLEDQLDLPKCTLREVLSYPHGEPITDDRLLKRVIAQVKLGYLLSSNREDIMGLDGKEKDWLELSPKERERLAIARAILGQPEIVVIDGLELDEDIERELYTVLGLLKASVIRTARLPTQFMLQTHEELIELMPEGSWNEPIPTSQWKPSNAACTSNAQVQPTT